jgi:hypothetical protein
LGDAGEVFPLADELDESGFLNQLVMVRHEREHFNILRARSARNRDFEITHPWDGMNPERG